MASKRRLRRKQEGIVERKCSKKYPYWSMAKAQKAVRAIELNNANNRIGILRSYACEYCGNFHVGHDTRSVIQSLEVVKI